MIAISVASPDDLPWIAELELRHYGGMRAVAPVRLEEWYACNPLGFLIVRDNGRRTGHATLLPLKPPMLRALMDGTRSENDIRADDIFAPADHASVRSLYVESVIAEPRELGELVRTFNRHIARLAQPELVEDIVVCPSTPAGDLLVANRGFERSPTSPYYVAKYGELVRQSTLLRTHLGAHERQRTST